jgi:TonB-dependent receptor
MRLSLLRAVAALSWCLGAIEAAAMEPHPITVPGGDLADVLTHLALDTNVDLLFASDLVRGRHSPGARDAGDLTEALRQILNGTGLDYVKRGERAITIIAPPALTPPPHAETGPTPVPEVTVREARLMTTPPSSGPQTADELTERDVLSAEALARHPDSTVADALARLVGISITLSSADPNLGGLDTVARGEGQFVTVRGLDSEYNVTLVNGVNVAQGQPYSRQVELGLMPPFGLDHIDVVKVSGADRDGDAIGGTIDFHTPDALDGAPFTRFTTRGQIDQRAMEYGMSAGGGAGQLEAARRFGPGDRFGAYFGVYYDQHAFVSSEQDSQSGEWGYRLTTTPGLGANPPGIRPEDNLVSLSVNPQFTEGDIQRYGGSLSLDWRGDDTSLSFRSTYGHDDTQQSVFQRGFQGIQYVTGIRQANGLYLTTTTDAQEHYWFETNPEQADLTTNRLGGESDLGRLRLSYDVFYSWGQNSRPDHLELSWGVQNPPGTYVGGLGGPLTLSYAGSPAYPVPVLSAAQLAALGDLNRLTAHIQGELNALESDQHKAGGQVDFRLDLSPGGESFIKGGLKLTASRRFTDDRDYLVPIVATGSALGQSSLIQKVIPQVIPGVYDYPVPVLNGDLVRNLILSAPREALTPDQYNQSTMWGWEDVGAGYLLGHAAFGSFDVEGGLRVEHSAVDTHYWASGWASSNTNYDKILPSLLLSWRPDAASLYRASIWTSYARPAFFLLGGGVTTDIGLGGILTITEGNPHLKSTDSTNFDVSGDWDLATGGHLSLAGFWKALQHYLFNQGSGYLDTESATAATTIIVTPRNGGSAHIGGIEAAATQRFSGLPAPFDGLGVDLNGTVQHSVAHLDNPALSGQLPLQDAPELLANASLSYEGGDVRAALSYRYEGDYLEQYGLWGGLYSNAALSKWVHETRSLDLSLGYRLSDGFEIGAQVRNLLADTTYYSTIGRHNDAVPQIIEAGRVFYLTTSYQF